MVFCLKTDYFWSIFVTGFAKTLQELKSNLYDESHTLALTPMTGLKIARSAAFCNS